MHHILSKYVIFKKGCDAFLQEIQIIFTRNSILQEIQKAFLQEIQIIFKHTRTKDVMHFYK